MGSMKPSCNIEEIDNRPVNVNDIKSMLCFSFCNVTHTSSIEKLNLLLMS